MSINVQANPVGIDDRYLEGLQTCFPGSWNAESYWWYLKRPLASRAPDIFTVTVDDELVAGVGLNYRRLALPGDEIAEAAILTAAWTKPAHRGRWHFTRLIEAAKRVAEEKCCFALLAFVTEENASRVALSRVGARGIPTRYVSAASHSVIKSCAREVAEGVNRTRNGCVDSVTFHYETETDWEAQMIRRPNPTTSLRVGESTAILEHVEGTDRLQHVPGSAYVETLAYTARQALRDGRAFFHFNSSIELGELASQLGFEVRNGYLMVLDSSDGKREGRRLMGTLLESRWDVQAGDRM